MIREGLKDEIIDLTRVIFMPNLLNSGLPVDEVLFPKEFTNIFICPKQAHNIATVREYRSEGWRVIEIPPREGMLGSGTVRTKMKLGEGWKSLVPKGTARVIMEYDLLRFLR